MSVSYAPPGESALDLWEERSNFNGAILAGVGYGVHFTLFLIAVPLLVKQRTKRKEWFFLTYTIVMFSLGTIFIGENTRTNQQDFIDDRNYPGGPNGHVAGVYGSPDRITGNAAFVVANWLADALLIYRCLLIYNFNYVVVILPGMMFMASIATGILVLFESGLPASNLWTTLSTKFILSYFTLSLSLNIILTSLIVIRLLVYRNRIRKSLGPGKETTYTSIAAMLVESSALYSTFNLIFTISFAKGDFLQNVFLPLLGEIQMISPLLIIIRVALGRGWSKKTADTVLTGGNIQFNQPLPLAPRSTERSTTNIRSSTVNTMVFGFDRQTTSADSTSEDRIVGVKKEVSV